MFLSFVAVILSVFVILVSLATLIPTGHWSIRIFDFPRLHLALLGLLALFLLAVTLSYGTDYKIEVGLLLISTVIVTSLHLYRIFPFTPIASKELSSTNFDNESSSAREDLITGITANVLYTNKKYQQFLNLVKKHDPDIVFVCEVNNAWTKQLTALHDEYPYTILKPLENGYGLALYSKLELTNEKVRYLVDKDRPSITVDVKLRTGARVVVYALHPPPPGLIEDTDEVDVPDEDEEIRDSRPRDAELLLVAKEVEDLDRPVLVIGDFNDTAWSHTTRLFKRMSGLKDPRVGRGFFTTFPASYPLLRVPIDHVFCSKTFRFVAMKVLENFGSDHLAVLFRFQLPQSEKLERSKHNEPTASETDRKEALKKIVEGQQE